MVVERMDCCQVCCYVFFFYGCDFSFCNFGVFIFIDEGGECWVICCCFCCQRVVCSDIDISNFYQSIWMCGVYFKIGVFIFNGKFQFYIFRVVNLVVLYGFDYFRLIVQVIQIVKQFLSIGGDFNKLLWDFFLFNWSVIMLVVIIFYLFVSQNCLVVWILVN